MSASTWSTNPLGNKRTKVSDLLGGSTAGGQGVAGMGFAGEGAVPLTAQPQQRSFASAASSSSKRTGPSPPAFPRPSLARGEPVVKDDHYESMERPAPASPAPNLLYLDLRQCSHSAEQVLDYAAKILGALILGFQFFAAQKTIGLVFANSEARAHNVNKKLGDSGLTMYPAPNSPVNLLKLTLQGVPFWDLANIKATLPGILAPAGKLVFLAPMVTKAGLCSDQWHATIARPDDSTDVPPETITLCGVDVIVDIPGQRRYCRHCSSANHNRPSCRQWSRERSRQGQLAKDTQSKTPATTTVAAHTTTATTTTTTATSLTETPLQTHLGNIINTNTTAGLADGAFEDAMQDTQYTTPPKPSTSRTFTRADYDHHAHIIAACQLKADSYPATTLATAQAYVAAAEASVRRGHVL